MEEKAAILFNAFVIIGKEFSAGVFRILLCVPAIFYNSQSFF